MWATPPAMYDGVGVRPPCLDPLACISPMLICVELLCGEQVLTPRLPFPSL